MQYIIFVFSTRAGAMALLDYCRKNRFSAGIVNTPREISASCGISVRVDPRLRGHLRARATQIATYVGTYLVQNYPTHHSVIKMND